MRKLDVRFIYCSLLMMMCFCLPGAADAALHGQGKQTPDAVSIVFPARFASLSEFLSILSRKSSNRYAAPAQDTGGSLASLNRSVAGHTLTADQAIRKYATLAKLDVHQSGSLVVLVAASAGPHEEPFALSTALAVDEGLKLIGSLTENQVREMASTEYVTTSWLSASQQATYIKFIRGTEQYSSYLASVGKPSNLTDKQIIDLPCQFYFVYTSSLRLRGPHGKVSDWLGIYDHIKNKAVEEEEGFSSLPDSNAFARYAITAPSGRSISRLARYDASPQDSIDITETTKLSLSDLAEMLRKRSHKLVTIDKRLPAIDILVTKGRYDSKEVMDQLTLAAGVETRSIGENLLFIGSRHIDVWGPQRAQELNLVATAEKVLGRAPLSKSIPLPGSLFTDHVKVLFTKLPAEQQRYIERRIGASNSSEFKSMDLPGCEVEFDRTLWWNGFFTEAGMVVGRRLQLW